MSEKMNAVLSRLNKEGKLSVEVTCDTLVFTHKETGVLLCKIECGCVAKELLAIWNK